MILESSVLRALAYLMQPVFDQVFITGEKSILFVVSLMLFGVFVVRAFSG
ncbi:hypothetical protein [Roseobacter weihaiensis]|nr:hypothetical protein [Roseobacter sp. H9]